MINYFIIFMYNVMNKCLNARYKVADDDSSFIRPINISRERKQLVNKQCDILIKKKHTP